MEAVCNSEPALSKLIGDLREAWKRDKWLKVKWTTGKNRSLLQNDVTYVWYGQVAMELRENSAVEVRRFCKLHFGVPILRVADSDYRQSYDTVIRPLAYETKLVAMDHWPVTQLMSKAQISEYQKAMQEHYEPLGVRLEYQEKPTA